MKRYAFYSLIVTFNVVDHSCKLVPDITYTIAAVNFMCYYLQVNDAMVRLPTKWPLCNTVSSAFVLRLLPYFLPNYD